MIKSFTQKIHELGTHEKNLWWSLIALPIERSISSHINRNVKDIIINKLYHAIDIDNKSSVFDSYKINKKYIDFI